MPLTPAFHHALDADLDELARVMRCFEEEWWIIGSAAIRLAGVADLDPNDIDILVSAEGASKLSAMLGSTPLTMPAHERFHSDIFFRRLLIGRDMEVMGGFSVRSETGWRPFWPRETRRIAISDGELRIPANADLKRMCQLFGRPKDIARIAALDALEV
jgi:hypothetical protein